MLTKAKPFFLFLVLAAATGCSWGKTPPPTPSPAAPHDLRCEYLVNPLGIDAQVPRLSWKLNDSRRGAVQAAYQVLVASSEERLAAHEGDLWDSGRIDSDQSVHVEYGGKSLGSRQQCFWKVRTWDGEGKSSSWSPTAFWEMALLRPKDWSAKWISTPLPPLLTAPVPMGKWIGPPTAGEKKTAYFRAEFFLNAAPPLVYGVINITADNKYTLYMNGTQIGEEGDCSTVEAYLLGTELKQGRNVVAVEASNAEGPFGVALGMRVYDVDDRTVLVQSSGEWLCSGNAPMNWHHPSFTAEGWVEAEVLADYGEEPWGKLPRRMGKPRQSIMVRRDFTLPNRAARARAYVSGLGMYELWINGMRVGSDIFTPGWTHYPKRVQYQVYDVTDLLTPGENAVGAILGNGWWSGGLGWGGGLFRFAKENENLRFLLQLEMECAGGSIQRIVTDRGWTAHLSPIHEDSLYHGETYDARLEIPGWNQPGFDSSNWQPVEELAVPLEILCAQKAPPLRITEELEAVRITELNKGVTLFDFGQNHAGRCRLTVQGPAGMEVQIRHSETLDPLGALYTENYRSARATDRYICSGRGSEEWEPRFTYRGFRYAELRGYPGQPTRETLLSQVLHSAPPMAGRFECSNPLINRICKNILWGQRSNMHSVPTDCPQRDERLGSMGDAQIFAATSCWNMEMALFYTKWMRDVLDSQLPDGAATNVSPRIVTEEPGKPGWGDAIIIIPWTVYQFYGDRRILEECYEGMKKWVEYVRRNSKDDLYETPGYGDWVSVVETPSEPIGSAYYFYSTWLFSRIARILGREKDTSEYAALAERIAEAFNKKHFDKETQNYDGGTQTANLLPLHFGITPWNSLQAVADNIAKDVIERDFHLSSGFLGTAALLAVLTRYGYHDAAYRVASSKTYPSLGYMVEKGATTVWERWNSDVMGPEMNSRNHFALGCMGQWFFEALGGINIDPEKPGFKHILFHPRPVRDLQWASAEYPSPYGTVVCRWRCRNDDLTLKIVVPPNTTATVWVPTFGKRDVRITENGETVLYEGKAGAAKWVSFVEQTDQAACFRVGAGQYDFVAHSVGSPPAPRYGR